MSDYPSMSHVQHITFEGNDCVVMSPEEYGAALADLEAKDYELSTIRAELTTKEKALSSAKIALDAKDRAYSVIEQRFSTMAAKAATTDSERECNERLTAEIDALTAELTEARRQLAAQPAVPEAVANDALALAYGYLWHVNNMRPGYDAPAGHNRPQLTPEKAAYKARAVLRELLTSEQRGEGINRADAILSATDSEVGK